MKKLESLSIKYVGYSNPSTEEEVELELLGLATAIAAAKQRIAVLNQSLKLQNMMKSSMSKEGDDEKAVYEASDTEKDK
jgi:hypothetical protein